MFVKWTIFITVYDRNNLKFSVGFVTATFQSITTIVTRSSVWEVGNLKCVVETLLLFVFVLATIICYYMSFPCISLYDIQKKMYLFY